MEVIIHSNFIAIICTEIVNDTAVTLIYLFWKTKALCDSLQKF